jgi:hypothetical protein
LAVLDEKEIGTVGLAHLSLDPESSSTAAPPSSLLGPTHQGIGAIKQKDDERMME